MSEVFEQGKLARGFMRWLSFTAFGMTLFVDQTDLFNPIRLGLGIVIAWLFAFLFRLFLNMFLSTFNSKAKKEHGRHIAAYSVEQGMLYMVPFALMAILATFVLRWPSTWAFMSTGTMAVGTASSIELNRVLGKQSLKNTVITSLVSFGFSFILTMGLPYVMNLPGIIQGALDMIPTLLGKGGGM